MYKITSLTVMDYNVAGIVKKGLFQLQTILTGCNEFTGMVKSLHIRFLGKE